MSFETDRKDQEKELEIRETAQKLAKLLNDKYPSDNKDEWGYRRHFSN